MRSGPGAFAIALGLLGTSSVLPPQQASPAQLPTFRAGVDLVQVDVRVLGRDRRPVTTLEAADFTILENGQTRPIVAFTHVTLPPPRATTSSWAAVAPDVATNAIPGGRFVVILIDRMIPYGWAARIAQRLSLAIVDGLGPDDVAAVIHTGPHAKPQNFTADRARLRNAIESLSIGTSLSAGVVSPNPALDRKMGVRSAECYCDVCSVEAVTQVANTLASVGPRPKTVFFIGSNIEPFAMDLADACYPDRRAATDAMVAATQRANLVVHTLDPTGLETPSQFSAGRRADGRQVAGTQDIPRNPNTLLVMADLTGGRAVLDTNDPTTRVHELLRESESFYLLGFTPASSPGESPVRRLEVKVRRPGLDVRTRRGDYSTTSEQPASVASSVSASSALPPALADVLPAATVPLAMSLVPVAQGNAVPEVSLAVIIGVEASSRDTSARGAGDPLTLRVKAFDVQGREQASTDARIDASTIGTSAAFDLLARLDVRPGRYEVRAAVDVPGAAGTASVYGYVDVPDVRRERVTVSGPLVHVQPERPIHVAEEMSLAFPARPTALRTFTATDRVTARLRIHQAEGRAPVPVNVQAQIVDTRDRIVVQERMTLGTASFTSHSMAEAVFELPLARLSAGDHLLRMTAEAGRTTSERLLRFQVR